MHGLALITKTIAVVLLGLVIRADAQFPVGCDDLGCGYCDSGAACDDCPSDLGGVCGEALWTATVDALFLNRSEPDSRVLGFNTVNPTENLNAENFDFGTETGVDVSLTRSLGACNALELRYFGIDGWDAAVAVATTPNELLRFNAAPPVFVTSGDAIAASYESKLHNTEINVSHEYCDWLNLMAGFRAVELDERGNADLVNPAVPFGYDVTTRNRLYGGQVGARVQLWCRDAFSLTTTGKAGVYGNVSNHHASSSTGVATVTAAGADDRTAFVGELGFQGAARLTDHLSLRGGYRLLWIDGVALATEQLAVTDFNQGTGFDGSGDVFYHGAFVGLELQH